MLSGLLITLDILVCVALISVVLLQRSEGGAGLGGGGGPTSLITARGAGDLLTRTTWILFGLFLALSIGLTVLGTHDRASSSVLERLKLQQANPNALSQPVAPPPTTPGAPLMAPNPQGAPAQNAAQGALGAPAPATTPAPGPQPVARAVHPRPTARPAAAAPSLEAPAPQPAPTLEAPAPQSAPAAPATQP
jgi:preprotein translocase subunit SecG